MILVRTGTAVYLLLHCCVATATAAGAAAAVTTAAGCRTVLVALTSCIAFLGLIFHYLRSAYLVRFYVPGIDTYHRYRNNSVAVLLQSVIFTR